MKDDLSTSIPPGLATIAAGRDLIPTIDFASYISRKQQTIRYKHSINGEYLGIRPEKLGGKLQWPVAQIAKLINGVA